LAAFGAGLWGLWVEPWLRFDWLAVMRAAAENFPKSEGV